MHRLRTAMSESLAHAQMNQKRQQQQDEQDEQDEQQEEENEQEGRRHIEDDTAEILKLCSVIADATGNGRLLRDAREMGIVALLVEEIVRAEVERNSRRNEK